MIVLSQVYEVFSIKKNEWSTIFSIHKWEKLFFISCEQVAGVWLACPSIAISQVSSEWFRKRMKSNNHYGCSFFLSIVLTLNEMNKNDDESE